MNSKIITFDFTHNHCKVKKLIKLVFELQFIRIEVYNYFQNVRLPDNY